MPGTKISEHPAATSVADADELVVNQSGTTKRATAAIVRLVPIPAAADAGRHPIVNAGGTAYSTSTYSEEEALGLALVL